MSTRPASYYEAESNNRVVCQLCPHYCHLKSGQKGLCRVRVNEQGELKTINYGEISSIALDPVEKKPLYHFYPGQYILSIGSFGCNLACPWCQNHHIATIIPRTEYVSPDDMADLAQKAREQGSVGLAYTYNEPSMSFEYVYECAVLVKEKGLKNVLVSNGYINPKPLARLLTVTDALNIDLKGFTPQFYRHYCKGKLDEVWDSIELAASLSHVEVTSLIIPELNDDPGPFREAARALSDINPDIPWHLSAFHPAYRFQDRTPTPRATLENLSEIAREFMHYVYLGNVGGTDNNTYCPQCGQVLVERDLYRSRVSGLNGNHCSQCGNRIPIVI